MKFIVSSSDLLKNLQVLGTILNTNNTLPILDNFLFEIDNNELNITSSDLETSLTSKLSIESSLNVKIAIPAKLLTDIIRSLPEQPLTFSINENNTIEINSNNRSTNIKIIDNGQGISKELGEKVFEPKFTTKTSGMGLGLGIVKNIIDSNNGSISFNSNLKKGTTFIIELKK